MKALKPFRYSGNKTRLLKFYKRPSPEIKRVVEPYLGSGAYLLASGLPGLGYEINRDVAEMWWWLQKVTPSELKDLDVLVEDLKVDPATPPKPDVRLLKGLSRGQETYVRINITGVYTGQLTSWKIYPQHRLPVASTIECLPRIKDIEIVCGSANEYVHQDGDMLFVDPPYLGTTAGYIEKSSKKNHEDVYDAKDTIDLISKTSNPVILTYGDGADRHFPGYDWHSVVTRKVPNIRRGGTVDRTEWVAYVNWRE
jgi:site-specific DNA-adenine methylase